MKLNKFILLYFYLSLFMVGTQAQDIGSILFGPNSKVNYMGQYDFKGKLKNGYGIERYKNGNLYVGDFNKNDISGRGMLIAFDKGISNVKDAVVYIGNWMNGKKEGKGTCYDMQGNVVFHGNFTKDKPSTSLSSPTSLHFQTLEMDDELFIGETVDEMPHGYGLKLGSDGAIRFGTFREGSPHGISMTLFAAEVWEVGRWKDGEYHAFNNSAEAESREQEYRELTKARRANVRSDLWEATQNFAQAAVTVMSITSQIQNGGATEGSEEVGESIADGKDYDYYFTKYKIWLSKTKNKYEDRINYKLKAEDGNSGRMATAALRVLRSHQRMLKTIRMAAKKNGHDIPAHKLESVTF